MSTIRQICRRRPVAAYVVLACTLSWTWWVSSWLLVGPVARGHPWPTQLPGLLGPAIAAVLVTAATDGSEGLADLRARLTRWRVPARWWLLSALTLLGALLVVLATHDHVDWSQATEYSGTPNLGLITTFLLVWLVNGIGEETGWRGFAVERLHPAHGLTATALWVFLAWAVWHLPLFLVMESFRDLGIAALGWLVGLASGSIVLTWIYTRAEHSILVVALWHTSYNFASGTALTDGAAAAIVSTAVIAAAITIAWHHRGLTP